MTIKKFKAPTEKEALEKVKLELGANPVIISVKRIKHRGIFRFFRKPYYEIAAASEEEAILEGIKKPTQAVIESSSGAPIASAIKSDDRNLKHESMVKDFKIHEQAVKIQNLEQKLNNTEELLTQIAGQFNTEGISQSGQGNAATIKYDSVVQLLFDSLLQNGVTESVADVLLKDLNEISRNDANNINKLIKIVYNRIIQIIGEPQPIRIDDEVSETKIIVCMGPTGVGKTTTIAKLSSYFLLALQKRVGLITADTYRVAAVDQLRTYADILGVELLVVYTPEEMADCVNRMKKNNDIVFIDTAGSSHKNLENMQKFTDLINEVPNAEHFLVLSTASRFEDMKKIVETYSKITDFKIIFTKFDETSSFGAVLNICYLTGKSLSYATHGQDVPDDIQIIQPEMIARSLLGSADV